MIVVIGTPGGGFLPFRSCLSLCSAPANKPMKTDVSSKRMRARTSNIFVRVVIGSFAMSFRRSENDFFAGACVPFPFCSESRRGASSNASYEYLH